MSEEIPDAAVEAAIRGIGDFFGNTKPLDSGLARAALQAALPAIRAAERERVREALLSDEAVDAAREAIGPRGLGSIAREIVPRILYAALATIYPEDTD